MPTRDPEGDERVRTLDRRRLLLSGGTLLAAGTAGCSLLDSSSGSPTPTDGSGSDGTSSPSSWPSPDGRYYSGLATELEFEGLPPADILYGESASATLDAYQVHGDGASTSTIDVTDDDLFFEEARRVEVPASVENPWDVTMQGVVEDRAVEAGDVLLGVAYLRSPDGAEVQYVAKDEDNLSTNMVRNATQPMLGPSWQRYDFRIQFDYASEAGTWWTELFMGFGQQTVDVGGLALFHFGQGVELDQLPTWQPSYRYEGRAEDAQWRQEAHQRIQDLRTADLTVTVVDDDGDAVEGATVDVAMQEHEFGFGTAIAVNQLPDGDPTYREILLENFNEAVPENGLKTPAWNGQYGTSLGPESTRAAIDWLVDQEIPTRGHALVWEEYDWMGIDPNLSEEEIDEAVKQSITERASEFAGRLPEWDMHNHPIWQDDIRSDIGEEVVPGWWEAASDAAPDATMYANEMNIIAGSSYQRSYDEYITWLLENDVDLGGIGFMGHFGIDDLTPPAELLSTFDRFAEHGVPLKITEFDVELTNRDDPNQVAAQADYVRDVLTAAFSHEAVESVLSWGFWTEQHWIPSAAYWGSDWSIRPHGEEYQRLVLEEWWTEESGETDADGAYATTGFKGEYEITASDGDASNTVSATLSDDGASVEITIG